MEIIVGLMLVTLAGLGTGTSAWPIKIIKDVRFEQYLFIFMLTGIILYPWLVVLFRVPDPFLVIKIVGIRPLLISNLLSISWGIANVLYLICVIRIGAALTGAILSAVGISAGVVLPMIFKGSGLFSSAPDIFSNSGKLIMVSLLVIIVGVVLVSAAGFGREKALHNAPAAIKDNGNKSGFLSNLFLAILAGLLSSGISLAFVYSQGPVIDAVKQQGLDDTSANFTVWALGMLGGGLVNVLYAAFMMTKKKTWHLLFARKEEFVYGSVIGLQFIISIILLGRGMLFLGILGASIGFAIQQSMQVIGNQVVGFAGGEWKGIKGRPRSLMYLAILVILVAVIILGYSNTLAESSNIPDF